MKKNTVQVALLGLGALSLSACATVTRGTRQHFYAMSEPPGATVTMTNGTQCTTPCDIKLKRKNEFQATFALAGYKSKTVAISSDVHGGGRTAVAGNLIAGGLIGGILDATNGSMNDLRPNPLKVVMAAETSAEESRVVDADRPKSGKKSKTAK